MKITEGLAIIGKYELKMFDGGDWNGFAGATPISEDIDPFYGEINRKDFAMTIVIDKNGIEIDFWEDPNCIDGWSSFLRENTFENSLKILEIFTFYKHSKEDVLFILDNFFTAF